MLRAVMSLLLLLMRRGWTRPEGRVEGGGGGGGGVVVGECQDARRERESSRLDVVEQAG